MPGQLVNVTVSLDDIPGAIVVPRIAVINGPEGNYVYRVSARGVVAQVPVTVLFDNGTDMAIQGGLKADDKVITDGGLRVLPGTHVTFTRPAAARPVGGAPRRPKSQAVNISRIFIERPIMTALVMAALILFGLFGYFSLPVSDLPNVDFPTIQVQANMPGANPHHHGLGRGRAAGRRSILHHRSASTR